MSNAGVETGESHTGWTTFIDRVRGFVASRVPSGEVDDVVQDTVLRIAESVDDLRDPERLESYVFGIARRTIADFHRRRSREPDTAPPLEAPASPSGEDAALSPFEGDHDVHEEVLSWLRPMAADLPDEYGEALILADFEGMKQADVAEKLGLSLSGAKSRIQRARVLLGESLRACCDVEFGEDARAVAFREREGCDDC